MLPSRTTFLIIGAGPTGLAAAVALLQQGCRDILIVDAVERNTRPRSSRALVVHAATLEELDTIGCAEPLVAIGIKGKGTHFYNTDGPLMDMDFTPLDAHTRFPYGLIVSQYSTERVLETKLEEFGFSVQRPYKLVGLDDEGEEGLIVTFESGETVKANYIIGADGARSTVRQLVKVGFADPDGKVIEEGKEMQMIMADVTFNPSLSLPRDELFGYSSSDDFAVAIPVPKSPWPESYDHLDDDILRIGFSVPTEDGPPPPSPPVEFFQKHLDRLRPTFLYKVDDNNNQQPVKIEKLLWSTRFRIHSAIADQFLARIHSPDQKNACRVVFLVGDAAHIHSPVGGQGMNLGLRDAIGLASVLTQHSARFAEYPQAADKILEDYAAARRTRALSVISLTKRSMSSISFIGSTGWAKHLVWIIKLVVGIPFVREKMLLQVSGLADKTVT